MWEQGDEDDVLSHAWSSEMSRCLVSLVGKGMGEMEFQARGQGCMYIQMGCGGPTEEAFAWDRGELPVWLWSLNPRVSGWFVSCCRGAHLSRAPIILGIRPYFFFC